MTPVTEHHSGSTCAHSAKWCANIDLPRVEECVCTKFRLNSAQFSFCSSENLDLIAKLAWQNEIKLSPMSAKLQRLNRSLAKCVRSAAKPGSFTPAGCWCAVCSVLHICAAHQQCVSHQQATSPLPLDCASTSKWHKPLNKGALL